MAIRAVIFDLGGVLIQQVDRGRRSFWETRLAVPVREIANQVWLSPVGQKALTGQATEEQVWAEVGRHFELTPEELIRLESDFKGESEMDQDLLSFIRKLHQHCKTGVISDAFSSAREKVQAVIPADTFDVLVFSAEEGMVKPAPAIFRRALNLLDVEPREVIFVDDMPHNVAGARALGIHAIQFRDSAQVRSDILRRLDDPTAGGL